MALSMKTHTYRVGGKEHKDHTLYDPHVKPLSAKEAACCCNIFFGPTKSVLAVFLRLGIWTGLGAAAGACSGSGVGAGPGAIVGFVIGCFSFLCPSST